MTNGADARIKSFGVKDGGLDMQLEGGACQALVEAFGDQFKKEGGVNYIEMSFNHPEIGMMTVTVQKTQGMTPAEKVARMKALVKAGEIEAALAL